MKHFKITLFIYFTVSLLLTLVAKGSEVPYIALDEQASPTLVPIFNLESSDDMYVRVGYSGSQPSIAIITPIGVPCTFEEVQPIYEKNAIVFEIPSAEEGQWYIHIAEGDSDRLDISYGRLNGPTVSGMVVLIVFCVVAVFSIFWCIYHYQRLLGK